MAEVWIVTASEEDTEEILAVVGTEAEAEEFASGFHDPFITFVEVRRFEIGWRRESARG